MVIRHERQYVSAGLLIVVVSLLAAGAAAAQPAAHEQALGLRWFTQAAIVLWSSAGAPKDPEGPGYLTPYFHGAVDRPSVGGLVGMGVLLTRRLSVSTELAAQWPTSSVITEDSRTHSEQTTVTSTYRVQQTVVSLVAGWDAAPAKTVTVRPVLGMTVSRSRQSLTERSGQYIWYGGTLPVSRPDVSFSHVHVGGMVGADLRWRSRGPLSATALVRAHWIRRPENALPYRDVPAIGPMVLYVGAGVRWSR